jgi:hypothetical protein
VKQEAPKFSSKINFQTQVQDQNNPNSIFSKEAKKEEKQEKEEKREETEQVEIKKAEPEKIEKRLKIRESKAIFSSFPTTINPPFQLDFSHLVKISIKKKAKKKKH